MVSVSISGVHDFLITLAGFSVFGFPLMRLEGFVRPSI